MKQKALAIARKSKNAAIKTAKEELVQAGIAAPVAGSLAAVIDHNTDKDDVPEGGQRAWFLDKGRKVSGNGVIGLGLALVGGVALKRGTPFRGAIVGAGLGMMGAGAHVSTTAMLNAKDEEAEEEETG